MGMFSDFIEGRVLRDNPQMMDNYLAEQQASKMAKFANQVYGQRGQAAKFQPQMQATEGPMLPGQERGTMPVNQQITDARAGTGVFDTSVPEQQRLQGLNKRMLQTGLSGFIDQWANNNSNMQNSSMANLGSMAKQIQKQQYDTANPTKSSMMKNVAASLGPNATGPQFQEAMRRQLSKPGMSINMGKVAQPVNTTDLAKWELPNGKGGWKQPQAGMSMLDIGQAGGRIRQNMAGGDVGKYVAIKGALDELPELDKFVFNEDGSVNRDMLRRSTAQTLDPTGGYIAKGVGYTTPESEQFSSGYERGIQAITRQETGAAMASEEIANTRQRFQPNASDSDEAIKSKRRAYEYFLKNASELMNPNGIDMSTMSTKDKQKALETAANKAFSATSASDNQQPTKEAPPGLSREQWEAGRARGEW